MSDKEKKENAIPVTLTIDVERKITNDGAGRSLAVALKMFKDTVLKLSAKKVLILARQMGAIPAKRNGLRAKKFKGV